MRPVKVVFFYIFIEIPYLTFKIEKELLLVFSQHFDAIVLQHDGTEL